MASGGACPRRPDRRGKPGGSLPPHPFPPAVHLNDSPTNRRKSRAMPRDLIRLMHALFLPAARALALGADQIGGSGLPQREFFLVSGIAEPVRPQIGFRDDVDAPEVARTGGDEHHDGCLIWEATHCSGRPFSAFDPPGPSATPRITEMAIAEPSPGVETVEMARQLREQSEALRGAASMLKVEAEQAALTRSVPAHCRVGAATNATGRPPSHYGRRAHGDGRRMATASANARGCVEMLRSVRSSVASPVVLLPRRSTAGGRHDEHAGRPGSPELRLSPRTP